MRGKHDLLVDDDLSSLKKSSKKFPYYEEKLKFGHYGEIMKYNYQIFNKNYNLNLPIFNFRQKDCIKFETTSGDKQNKTSDEDEEVDLCDLPSKCVEFEQNIYVAAKIVQIDFEGRSDRDSLKQVVLAIKPKHLILIRGNPYSTKAVYNFAKVFLDSKVFSPRIGQCLNLTSESYIYQVKKILFNTRCHFFQ